VNTNASNEIYDCIIVGAGLSGLIAASRLKAANLTVILIERELEVGGRLLAVRQAKDDGPAPRWDAGAQFFTVREPDFDALVSSWDDQGIVEIWSYGFATADGSYYADGHPRFKGTPDMSGIARHLAKDLDVQLGQTVIALESKTKAWIVTLQDGGRLRSKSVILTAPVPQSSQILQKSDLPFQEDIAGRLSKIRYDPCIALLLLLEGPSHFPSPGGMWPTGEPIAWMADNFIKEVSPVPGTITIHAGPEFSTEHWDLPDALISNRLVEAAGIWLGEEVRNSRIHRWKFSKPNWLHPDRYMSIDAPSPLLLAGDAFAGPRVEGAALSGLAAANHLLNN
jgi:predicted NAD/FAD-dependent oxidoreductase